MLNKNFKLIVELFKTKFGSDAKIEVKKQIEIDESKLNSIKQDGDFKNKIDFLKSNSKPYNEDEEKLQALEECFGKPVEQHL